MHHDYYAHDVVWSGYQVDQQAFRDLVAALYGRQSSPQDNIADVVGRYTRWKNQLPPKQRSKAPRVRFRASEEEEDDISHIFFPIRWIPYKSPRQFDDPTHPDYAAAHESTEKDKAKLERWLSVVDAKVEGKDPIRRDMFEFTTMKDLHPSDEWRAF